MQLVDIREFNCCGYPMRNADQQTFLFSAAVNLALAENAGLDISNITSFFDSGAENVE